MRSFYPPPLVPHLKPPNTIRVKSRIITEAGEGSEHHGGSAGTTSTDGRTGRADWKTRWPPWRGGMRLTRWVRHASRGALAAVAISLVAVICDHFDLLPD